MKVVVGTRFFETREKEISNAGGKILEFCKNSLSAGASQVLVAVNVAQDISGALGLPYPNGVMAFPVQPWGNFAMPLNGILVSGRDQWAAGANLLIASAEVVLTAEALATLTAHMDENTLVVGAVLEGHQYEPRLHRPATGRQTPWNTLALWNPNLLWRNGGFSILGDGPVNEPENAGVEEVVTIATIQNRREGIAKMVQVPGQKWDTSGFTGERFAAHEKKMASKNSRPARQLEIAGLPGPEVLHI